MSSTPDHRALLDVAIEEARLGLAEGGIPIGAALFDTNGVLLGRGHNRRVQENDPGPGCNWLPAPAGELFYLVLRLYQPGPEHLEFRYSYPPLRRR